MDFILTILTVVGINSILAVSLNYAAGFTGIMSVSHASFLGIGAYTSALMITKAGVSFPVSLALAILVTAIIAYVVSFPILKLREDSMMLVSVGFALICYSLFLNLDITNGALGVKKIPKPELFGLVFNTHLGFFLLVLSVLTLSYGLFWLITKSPYGTILQGIRENEDVMQNYGFNTAAYKRSVFVLSAMVAGIAGSLQAGFLTFIEPNLYQLLPSVFILVMVLLGGLASLPGSILGAAAITLVPELLRFANSYLFNSVWLSSHSGEIKEIIFGLTMFLLILLRPKGILGKFKL